MVLDVISFLSNEEQFLTKVGGQQPTSLDLPKKIRRLSLQFSQEEEVKQLATMSFSHVRSLTVSTDSLLLPPKLSTFLVLRVLDLSNCAGVANHHFREICNMFHLRYLNIGGHFITAIPMEIQNLQFLQVLVISSVADTIRMPSTFIHLQQLLQLCCHIVRLPDGFGKLTSLLEVTITIESPSMLHYLGCLTELRTLAIDFFIYWDESYEEPFIQSLSNLVNLKSLKIEGTMMISLHSERDKLYPGLQQLRSIDMKPRDGFFTGMCSVFVTSVPRWMSSLCFLSSINIILLSLGEQDIQVLGSIPSLSDLIIYVKETTQDRDERLVIGKSHQFQCLTKLCMIYPSMEVVFAPGGMQNLKKLHLVFRVKEVMRKFGDCNLGLEHLLSLEHVSLEIFVNYTMPKEVEAVEDEIRKALDMNPGEPTLIIKRNSSISRFNQLLF